MSLAFSDGPSRVGACPPSHLRTETDPVSETDNGHSPETQSSRLGDSWFIIRILCRILSNVWSIFDILDVSKTGSHSIFRCEKGSSSVVFVHVDSNITMGTRNGGGGETGLCSPLIMGKQNLGNKKIYQDAFPN
jgi:hypothetical protein